MPSSPKTNPTLAALIFPHQLFEHHPVLEHLPAKVLLIEDSLFFGDSKTPLKFHRLKLAFHLATMSSYEDKLRKQGCAVERIKASAESTLEQAIGSLTDSGFTEVVVTDVHDFLLEKRLGLAANKAGLTLTTTTTPTFLNSKEENEQYRASRKRWFMADFYKFQRRRLNILMEDDEPEGGKWSFDESNRKKIPKTQRGNIPYLPIVKQCKHVSNALARVKKEYPDNPGTIEQLPYPIDHKQARAWLDDFLNNRFELFGVYEDAMLEGESSLFHSILTPLMNVGLLTPDYVVKQAMLHAKKHDTPINSVEGFIRQIIGWREFMRATYVDLGVTMRTGNHWYHQQSMPACFYDGTTGIPPIDDTIHRINETAYCHHIERLMILGGFMFLCEIKPDDIYAWFMEMFIDAYDWVMVPNVYAMSQHADGGLITTKPYFSGSNYVLKMSDYKRGDWCDTWDGLFWRWIIKNKDSLQTNHRWSMMCKNAERLTPEKREMHLHNADAFFKKLGLAVN